MNSSEATVAAFDFGDGEDLVTLSHLDINLKGLVTVWWRSKPEVLVSSSNGKLYRIERALI
jgi:hypothetical protein